VKPAKPLKNILEECNLPVTVQLIGATRNDVQFKGTTVRLQELLTLREHMSLLGGVPCCHVRYDFRNKTMFGTSLPPVVCMRVHALITLYVCACA
jgi:hypothetical protein